MSYRSLLEFNHDDLPNMEHIDEWAAGLLDYLMSGDPKHLPDGVTFFYSRHHSDPCPMGDPPRGWDNTTPPRDNSTKGR